MTESAQPDPGSSPALRASARPSPSPSTAESSPSVLFVCVKNGGKSQMAAGLMRHTAGDTVRVHSAGTKPGSALNAESMAALEEIGADLAGEHPKPIATELLDAVDRVVLIGGEVQLEEIGSAPVERWVTDEPSERGITGMERMRLIREDLAARVAALHEELLATQIEGPQ